jgi:hypothetical protein
MTIEGRTLRTTSYLQTALFADKPRKPAVGINRWMAL